MHNMAVGWLRKARCMYWRWTPSAPLVLSAWCQSWLPRKASHQESFTTVCWRGLPREGLACSKLKIKFLNFEFVVQMKMCFFLLHHNDHNVMAKRTSGNHSWDVAFIFAFWIVLRLVNSCKFKKKWLQHFKNIITIWMIWQSRIENKLKGTFEQWSWQVG